MRSSVRFWSCGIASLLVSIAVAQPVQAVTLPEHLSPSVKYRVVGTISPSCSLGQPLHEVAVAGLQNAQDDTVNATDTDLPFALNCTAPVTVSLNSRQGGLKSDAQTSDPDFTTLVPYRATLDLPGQAAVLECQSEAMAGQTRTCSRQLASSAFAGNGRVRVHTAASNRLLVAGQYTDTLTLTISPQLSGDGHGEVD